MVLLFPTLLTNAYPKAFNFVNTDRPCCKMAKAYQKTFTIYELDLNIGYDYETTNDCQLHKKVFLVKFQFHNIDMKYCANSVLLSFFSEKTAKLQVLTFPDQNIF